MHMIRDWMILFVVLIWFFDNTAEGLLEIAMQPPHAAQLACFVKRANILLLSTGLCVLFLYSQPL